MSTLLQRTKSSLIIMSVVSLVLGLLLVIFPATSIQTICLIIGWCMAGVGFLGIIYFILLRHNDPKTIFLIFSIILFILGLFIIIFPNLSIKVMFVIFGCFILFHGIEDIYDNIAAKKCGFNPDRISLIFSVATILLGIFVIVLPFTTAEIIAILCGVSLIIDALFSIFFAFKFSEMYKISN